MPVKVTRFYGSSLEVIRVVTTVEIIRQAIGKNHEGAPASLIR
jgi:hypothetical protein